MVRAVALTVFGALLTLGCDGVGHPEAEGAVVPFGEALTSTQAQIAIPVADGRVLIDSVDGLVLVRDANDEGTTVGRSGEFGVLRAVTHVEGGTVLVGSETTLVLQDSALFASPVTEALVDGEEILDVEATPRADHLQSDLWVLTDRGLYLFRDGGLSNIAITGVESLEGAVISTAPVRRGRALWMAVADAVYELEMRDGVLQAGRVADLGAAEQMVADGSGTLWLLSGSRLSALGSNRELVEYELPFTPTQLLASDSSQDLWIVGSGTLWHHQGQTFRNVTGVDPAATLMPGPDGTLLAASAAGVTRFHARHRVRVLGIEDGGRIADRTAIEVDFPFPERATTVEALLDGKALALDPMFSAFLDPAEIEFGAHELSVRVTYDDGTLAATQRLSFQVGLEANWSEDIRPLFTARCAMCHGMDGSAPTQLDSKESWQQSIESILFNVREQRMPIGSPPLEPDAVALIEAWAAAGFPD